MPSDSVWNVMVRSGPRIVRGCALLCDSVSVVGSMLLQDV